MNDLTEDKASKDVPAPKDELAAKGVPATKSGLTPEAALERLLRSYRRYYNLNTEGAEPPFAAEADFHSHDTQYFLVKRATLAEVESNEYVFFSCDDLLTAGKVQELEACAWERGTSRVVPHDSHRSTDVVLIMLAERIEEDAQRFIKSIKRYQSYRFTLQGWSHFQVIALETSTGRIFCNKRGESLRKLFRNIF